MQLKFSNGDLIQVSHNDFRQMIVLAQAYDCSQHSTTDKPPSTAMPSLSTAAESMLMTKEEEIDLSHYVVVGLGPLTAQQLTSLLSNDISKLTTEQLLTSILICNYLGWECKLPLLYQQLAKQLCATASLADNNAAIIRKMTRPVSIDGYDADYSQELMYGNSNQSSFLNSNSFRLLWLWRLRVFGPPTSDTDNNEKKLLQLYWWLLNGDPQTVDDNFNKLTVTDDNNNSSGQVSGQQPWPLF